MNNTERLEANIGKKISYRNNGSRRVISGIVVKNEDGYSTKLGVLYIKIDPEMVSILSSEI